MLFKVDNKEVFKSLLSCQYPKINIQKLKIWDGLNVDSWNYHLIAGGHLSFKHWLDNRNLYIRINNSIPMRVPE